MNVYAEDIPTCNNDSECQQKIDEYNKKLSELGHAKDTLSNSIKILDSQIALTTLKINQTAASINTLEQEINGLTAKIDQLNEYLNQLSVIYINEVSQNYKLQKRIPPFAYLLTKNFNDYWNQQKYIISIQKNSQDNLLAMETTRTNFDMQKNQKAQKQAEMEELKKKMASQQNDLNRQKNNKNKLLESTKNDEKKYAQMLAYAQSQLNALRNFSKTEGSSCLASSPGIGSDGNFYSQRDPKWCRQIIGLSTDPLDTIGNVGCYISSISMAFKKIGSNINPSVYALNPSNFSGRTAWANDPVPPSGYSYKQVSYSSAAIDKELKAGRYVIAQISMKNISGMHFIVIIGGSNGSYKIHDPWYGPDQNLTDHYSTSSIMSLRLITKI